VKSGPSASREDNSHHSKWDGTEDVTNNDPRTVTQDRKFQKAKEMRNRTPGMLRCLLMLGMEITSRCRSNAMYAISETCF